MSMEAKLDEIARALARAIGEFNVEGGNFYEPQATDRIRAALAAAAAAQREADAAVCERVEADALRFWPLEYNAQQTARACAAAIRGQR